MLLVALLGAKAPDFTLRDTEGHEVKLSEVAQEGPVLIVFWATWCHNCDKILDFAQKLTGELGGFKVLGITQDSPRNLSAVKGMAQGHGWTFPILFDPDKRVSLRFRAMAVPVTVIVDQDLNQVYYRVGYTPGIEDEIKAKLQELLGG